MVHQDVVELYENHSLESLVQQAIKAESYIKTKRDFKRSTSKNGYHNSYWKDKDNIKHV